MKEANGVLLEPLNTLQNLELLSSKNESKCLAVKQQTHQEKTRNELFPIKVMAPVSERGACLNVSSSILTTSLAGAQKYSINKRGSRLALIYAFRANGIAPTKLV